MKYYTGVGSRGAPKHVLSHMTTIAEKMNEIGYRLRSGKAGGPDTAFEKGCGGNSDIYVPWRGFNTGRGFKAIGKEIYITDSQVTQAGEILVSTGIMPWFPNVKSSIQRLHGRNVMQVLGSKFDEPSKLCVGYAEPDGDSWKGGTRSAFELSRHYGIPIFNLYFEEDLCKLLRMIQKRIDKKEKQL